MNDETPKCYSCILKLQGNPMIEVGGIGKNVEIMQFGEHGLYKVIGIREQKLYQCFTCKEVKIY